MVSRARSRYSAWMMSTMTTIAATTHTNQIRKPNASASERSGLGGVSRGLIGWDGERGGQAAGTRAQITYTVV
jgi:hypothetical protein